MSLASFWCPTCGAGYHAHEIHECKAVWRVVAPDGREWRNPRLMAAVSAAIEETKLQFPAQPSEPCVCKGIEVLGCERDCVAAPQHSPSDELNCVCGAGWEKGDRGWELVSAPRATKENDRA